MAKKRSPTQSSSSSTKDPISHENTLIYDLIVDQHNMDQGSLVEIHLEDVLERWMGR